MTQTLRKPCASLVDLLASADRPKQWVERRLAEMALGLTTSLKESRLPVDQARADLFNLDNYTAIRTRRLRPELRELFEWGMELGSVARVAPEGLNESSATMTRLARGIIEHAQPAARRARNGVKRPVEGNSRTTAPTRASAPSGSRR